MSNYNEAVYMVQYESHLGGEWMDVVGIMYSQYRNAVSKMGAEMSNDPDYNHRIIKLTKTIVVKVSGADDDGNQPEEG